MQLRLICNVREGWKGRWKEENRKRMKSTCKYPKCCVNCLLLIVKYLKQSKCMLDTLYKRFPLGALVNCVKDHIEFISLKQGYSK